MGTRSKFLHAEETIITWSDAEIGTDVALSFQEADGCNSVWYAVRPVLCNAFMAM